MTVKSADSKIDELLGELCDRNVPVELHHIKPNGELIVARSRLLGRDSTRLLLDKPQSIGQKVTFRAGHHLTVYTQIGGSRYRFETQVVEPFCKFDLNDEVRVRGLSISAPTQVADGQRRNDYRASTVSFDSIIVDAHEAGPHAPESCPVDAGRFAGQMVNLSRGGLLMKVAHSDRRDFGFGEQFFVTFALSDTDEALTFWGELRHDRRIRDGESHLIGFKFFHWPKDDFERKQRRLGQFVAEAQRLALRNR
jgi:c-di-GMP-binding flagellar brake protein YcgR